ncbi:uncharacterized protein LOC129923337 [Biomphalaria glabrata]|uniref:RNA-directed DNA polymerase n=1 Tax=Biomphalaria glabrata TaxID=6526 RepID=A0A9W2Z4A2_BIOGL|nr:uncharacterized protein LOC129923337 [Biomphalaria glabrata]
MERLFRPKELDIEPSSPSAAEKWLHWLRTFENFISSVSHCEIDKKKLLENYVSSSVFQYISECTTFEESIKVLQNVYVKPKSEIFARHMITLCRQENRQTVDSFLLKLKSMAKDCDFKAVTAEEHRDIFVRDAFITGLASNSIRLRLLEKSTLTLQCAYEEARQLEYAHNHAMAYNIHSETPCGASADEESLSPMTKVEHEVSAATSKRCFFCGNSPHQRFRCPARDATCNLCGKRGHFQKVCKSTRQTLKSTTSAIVKADDDTSRTTTVGSSWASTPASGLTKSTISILVNGVPLKALVDTGSSESYISSSIAKRYKWKLETSRNRIYMASTHLSRTTHGHIFAKIKYKDEQYESVKLSLLDGLVSDVILGLDFISQHEKLMIPFDGKRSTLQVCTLKAARVEAPRLFANLAPNCHPIATKSRKYSMPDSKFIQTEIKRLLSDKIIEPSTSPWRAQIIVTTNERHKKRMVIDYSQTINRFTYLDTYPVPKVDELVQEISKYSMYSTFDLKSAYHQIPIRDDEKQYTAFEAGGKLYQFCRIPFGVTNGVAAFQRTINTIIEEAGLQDTFAYVDNVTICGLYSISHDQNLQRFLNAAKKYGITFNNDKSAIATNKVCLLGYEISQGQLRPDPERFQALRNLHPPQDMKSQKRVIGLLSYYSQWIPNFSNKIHLLVNNKAFPPPEQVQQAFKQLKHELENAAVSTIDYNRPLTVETDASDIAITATLNQDGRPVAFFSRTLTNSERRHSAVEKEAYAIVEALRKWQHYLISRPFTLVTDQRSVSFMFDQQNKGKIKNEKIQRWRLELSCFQYDVVYRPGKQNVAADTFSRNHFASAMTGEDLKLLHNNLCHPGVTRLLHFVRTKNLPFSCEDVRKVVNQCKTCAELKPRFFKQFSGTLIKATQPFQRVSIDFKGPLPSATHNKYLLTMVDEYSRFPFAYPCPDMSSSTVIKCLNQLFSFVGMPEYVHSDRGTSFMSREVQSFLHERGIATSRTTAFNPSGNGQIERLNKTLWNAVTLALKDLDLPISRWELVLNQALYSIRSLLSTATNETPHERVFRFNRKSSFGISIPTWLSSPGRVLLRRENRSSKYDPLTEEVELLMCNPQYAVVRLPSGKEETVSLRRLAPTPSPSTTTSEPSFFPQGEDNEYPPETQNTEVPVNTPTVIQERKEPLVGSEDLRALPLENTPLDAQELTSDSQTVEQDSQPRYNLRERRTRPNYRV